MEVWNAEPPMAAGIAQKGYIICATPRSGSYFLCDLLRSTRQLGRPHEYFDAETMRKRGLPGYPTGLHEQIDEILTRGATANGVFGAKLFPRGMTGERLHEIRARLGDLRWIFLERDDLLGQAISLFRAGTSGAFFEGVEEGNRACYDSQSIRDGIERIAAWNVQWRIFFAQSGIVPLHLKYEDVSSQPSDAVSAIARHLDEPVSQICLSDVKMRVQRDDLTTSWRTRFLTDHRHPVTFSPLRTEGQINRQQRFSKLGKILGWHARRP